MHHCRGFIIHTHTCILFLREKKKSNPMTILKAVGVALAWKVRKESVALFALRVERRVTHGSFNYLAEVRSARVRVSSLISSSPYYHQMFWDWAHVGCKWGRTHNREQQHNSMADFDSTYSPPSPLCAPLFLHPPPIGSRRPPPQQPCHRRHAPSSDNLFQCLLFRRYSNSADWLPVY